MRVSNSLYVTHVELPTDMIGAGGHLASLSSGMITKATLHL